LIQPVFRVKKLEPVEISEEDVQNLAINFEIWSLSLSQSLGHLWLKSQNFKCFIRLAKRNVRWNFLRLSDLKDTHLSYIKTDFIVNTKKKKIFSWSFRLEDKSRVTEMTSVKFWPKIKNFKQLWAGRKADTHYNSIKKSETFILNWIYCLLEVRPVKNSNLKSHQASINYCLNDMYMDFPVWMTCKWICMLFLAYDITATIIYIFPPLSSEYQCRMKLPKLTGRQVEFHI
jgi:hypothetical protein